MAKGSRRGRVRDKWKDKKWIIVNAPPALGGNPINYIPTSSAENAKGRIIENTLFDVYQQDPNQHQIKIYVQLDKVTEASASTIFVGHKYAKEYLRSLVRRGSSMITFIKNYRTIDGFVFRIVTVIFTQRRVNTSSKHAIRLTVDKKLEETISKLTLDDFIKEITVGSLNKDLLAEAKKIAFIRHLGIRKTKLVSTPESRSITEAKPVEPVPEITT
ncbi:MAG: 30S ribosomal protein S3ae [Nitrososphaeraceae archaeon]